MATMINNNINSNYNVNFDALRPLSIFNQNRLANQRELQRTSAARLNDNAAIDNVSAYSLSESLRIRTRMLDQANQNIQNDTALLKTAQGRGDSIVESIKEIQQLAFTATEESLTDEDRLVIQKDINRLVNKISADSQITFNGRKLIDGSSTTGNPATATVLSNNSLYRGTNASTALTALQNSNGTNLGIEASDRITASYVQNGNTYTTTFTVGNNTLEDIFVNLNKINGVTLTDSAFIGGGKKTLTKPVEPPKPIAPIEPVAPAAPTAPIAPTAPNVVSEPVAPLRENYADEATYNAAVDRFNLDNANYEEYLEKQRVFESAYADYERANAKYEAYLEKNPDAAEADSSVIADYNRYVSQKDNYDNKLVAFNSQYEKFADYVENAPEQNAAYANYATYLETAPNTVNAQRTGIVAGYNEYLRNYNTNSTAEDYRAAYEKYGAYVDSYRDLVEQYQKESNEYAKLNEDYLAYKKDYEENFLPQYQKDLENYNIMAVDIVRPDSNGLSVEARKPGLDEQISGVSINVTDASGNTKSAATAALNNFRTTTYAEDARKDNSVNFQIGETIDQTMNFGFNDMRAEAFGLKGANGKIISIATKEDADAALATIDNALAKATAQLQTIGSSEKRLGYIADSLAIEIGNIQEPDLMVRNAGMAKTLTVYALDFFQRDRVQSMFAVANQHSSAVFALLR